MYICAGLPHACCLTEFSWMSLISLMRVWQRGEWWVFGPWICPFSPVFPLWLCFSLALQLAGRGTKENKCSVKAVEEMLESMQITMSWAWSLESAQLPSLPPSISLPPLATTPLHGSFYCTAPPSTTTSNTGVSGDGAPPFQPPTCHHSHPLPLWYHHGSLFVFLFVQSCRKSGFRK